MNRSLLCAAALLALPALADEGMWTYNNFPAAKVKAKYGFEPTKDWLDHLRLSSVRIAGGCSASVVSPNGLVMTNHHCARECIENLSGLKKKDFNKDGFYAKTEADEARCPGYELNQLAEITNVTARVQKATAGVADDKFNDAQKAEIAAIEKECGTSDDVRCEVVGTQGTASLVPTAQVSTRVAGINGLPVLPDFVAAFADGYRLELVAWAVAASRGTIDGPSAWDGYVANVVAEAGVASLRSGTRQEIAPGPRPELYAG